MLAKMPETASYIKLQAMFETDARWSHECNLAIYCFQTSSKNFATNQAGGEAMEGEAMGS
jgi:hypothetical protein